MMHSPVHTVPPLATACFGREPGLEPALRFGRALSPQMMVGRGDGKRRRPKADKVETPAAAPPPPAALVQPGRVTQDSLLSARRQIALVRAFRARQSKGAPGPRHRSSFRKKSGADAAAASAAAELGDLPAGKYSVTSTPLLLVDGYNVIGFWPRLKKRRDRDDMEGARQMLLDDLVSYNSPKRYDIVVVFDAVPSPGDRLDAYLGMGVVFTPSADLYIETELRRITAEGQRPVWAATGDRQIQVAASTYGANVMSTRRLVTEMKGSRDATPALITEWNRQEAQRRPVFLEDQLDGLGRELLMGAAPVRKLTQRERKLLQEKGGQVGHLAQEGQPGQSALGLLGGQPLDIQEGGVRSGAAPARKLSQRERKLLQEPGQGQLGHSVQGFGASSGQRGLSALGQGGQQGGQKREHGGHGQGAAHGQRGHSVQGQGGQHMQGPQQQGSPLGGHASPPSVHPPPAHALRLGHHATSSYAGGMAALPIQRRLTQRQRTFSHGRESESRREGG
jgi:hypothetical protein